MSTQPLLQIEGLHARAADAEILRGVDLTVERDEIAALMGPNGSGKSTLANVLMGNPNYEVTAGRVLFDGEEISALGCLPRRSNLARRSRIGDAGIITNGHTVPWGIGHRLQKHGN